VRILLHVRKAGGVVRQVRRARLVPKRLVRVVRLVRLVGWSKCVRTLLQVCEAEGDVGQVRLFPQGITKAAWTHSGVPATTNSTNRCMCRIGSDTACMQGLACAVVMLLEGDAVGAFANLGSTKCHM
jgi:hypothetical protein